MGREKPGAKHCCLVGAYIPSGCAQTMWSCLCSKKQKWYHLPMMTNNSHNNKQCPQQQLTIIVQHSMFSYVPQKHHTGSRRPKQQSSIVWALYMSLTHFNHELLIKCMFFTIRFLPGCKMHYIITFHSISHISHPLSTSYTPIPYPHLTHLPSPLLYYTYYTPRILLSTLPLY